MGSASVDCFKPVLGPFANCVIRLCVNCFENISTEIKKEKNSCYLLHLENPVKLRSDQQLVRVRKTALLVSYVQDRENSTKSDRIHPLIAFL